MEIFYSTDIAGNACRLDADESAHCIKVLRHRKGDIISVIDGKGSLMKCRIVSDSPKGAETEIIETVRNWGGHPYRLHLAVCPTKNNDRYEWFAEKACEIGVDTIIPIIGEHSERKVFKTSRIEKILISAAKQSLKGAVPEVADPMPVREFILKYGREGTDETYENAGKAQPAETDGVSRMIAYCFEDGTCPRISIREVLESLPCNNEGQDDSGNYDRNGPDGRRMPQDIYIMIGPEGDFSREEALLALRHGFIPIHLGPSRLRTETAAVTAAEAVYFRYM